MATVEEIDEMMSLAREIRRLQEAKETVKIETEILNREMEVLSEAVKVQNEQNVKKKEMLELLVGNLNRSKELSAAISACKSTFARGSAEPLLWFSKAQVNKHQLLQEMEQTEVEEQIQKIKDDYGNQNPKYRELMEKQIQLVKLEDKLKKKDEEITKLKKFIALDTAFEDMMLREKIIEVARVMVRHNSLSKTTSESTSVVKRNSPMDEKEQLKSIKKLSTAAEPLGANVHDISGLEMPPMRWAVKLKPIEVSVEPARTVSSDEKLKFQTVAKATNQASKTTSESTSLVKHNRPMHKEEQLKKFVKRTKSAELSDHNVKDISDFKMPSVVPSMKRKPLETSFDLGTTNDASKSTSNIDIAMESPDCSDGSDIKTNSMELSSNASSIEKNTPMSKSMEGTSKHSISEMPSSFNIDFDDQFGQFTSSIKSKSSTATSADATLASDNENQFSDLDFDRTPRDFRISSPSQPTSDGAFNLISPDEGDYDFSSLFK